MKKMLFVAALIVLSTAILRGKETQTFSAPDGTWSCQIQYIGKNKGQEDADLFKLSYTMVEMLSNNQLDLVRKMLNHYQHGKGDTFYLTLSFWPRHWSFNFPFTSVMVLVEYNTNTDWVDWAYNLLSQQ